jgi:lipopolysaccharide heptosyltransferase I
MAEDFKNILIVKPSSLGDIVMTLPALTALRRTFPDAKISWLVRPEFAPLIEDHPHLSEIIHFDRKFLGKLWYHPFAFGAFIGLVSRLRKRKFDAVFDFQGLFRSAFMAWVSGAKQRFGPKRSRELASWFYTEAVEQDRDSIHVVDYYDRIVEHAGAPRSEPEFVLPPDPASAESTKEVLAAAGVDPDRYAVLIPGSAHPAKCWPVERFAAIADHINTEYGLSIITIGTASEKPAIEQIKKQAKTHVTDLAGQTTLKQLVPLLSGARLVVGNDTGPAHIAAAVNVPLVVIFGRANPIRLYPYKRKECVAGVEPFTRGFDIKNLEPKYDVRRVTVEEVRKKIRSQMTR